MTDDHDLKRNTPYSAREKVEHWLTSHPRQYFTSPDLAKRVHLRPATVRRMLQELRADGWEFEQFGGGRSTHQRYLQRGDVQPTVKPERCRPMTHYLDVQQQVDALAALLIGMDPQQQAAWLIGLMRRIDEWQGGDAFDEALDQVVKMLQERQALERWPQHTGGRAWRAGAK